ncbi:Migration and invasion enhancer 1 [Holothuria leucospilota]|uniref:Migration and invasion enhancer 1 n=1 Tax=Holothuria leucospilota TaxID=206669 RepID=A0A9Q1C0H4_HOLLE|nr:Migration and invasion enhancer 1 [Holothuria leucospilota]
MADFRMSDDPAFWDLQLAIRIYMVNEGITLAIWNWPTNSRLQIQKSRSPERLDGPVSECSFEVKLNDEVVFSKLETGGFPIMEKLVEYIKSFDGQSKVVPLTETQSSCVIL